MQRRYPVVIILIGFAVVFWFLFKNAAAPTAPDTDKVAGNALTPEALPAQKDDLILVNSPLPQSTVTSPIAIRGKARGNWYFEGSFPIVLTDTNGNVLAEHYATAQGEWMTTEYVPFAATLSYTKPAGVTKGYLILKKDNPSGEAKFDNSITIPVTL